MKRLIHRQEGITLSFLRENKEISALVATVNSKDKWLSSFPLNTT